jgi:predicted enzyme related to lactoylglutathione lyase
VVEAHYQHNMETNMRQKPRPFPRALLAGLVSLTTSPLAAAPLTVPAITIPASTEHHEGKPIFAELITPGMAASKRFYSSLLGWSFRDVRGGKWPYAEAYLAGAPVAGLVEKPISPSEHRQPAWLNFFATANLDAAAQTATENGAKLLAAPHDLAGRGREAVLRDPQGAVFAMLMSSSGDPPDGPSPPGTWIWRALIVPDAGADASFYKKIFGYQLATLPAATSEQHMILTSDDTARASVNTRPPGRPDMPPHWLAFVRVDDVTQAVAKVTALGGRILVPPRPDRHGGMIAVVADPEGAPFGLMDLATTPNPQVTK